MPTAAEVRRALRRAGDGAAFNPDEARALLACRGDDLANLMATAGRIRDAGLAAVGQLGIITYSPKVFVPVTTLCRDRCHCGTFAQTPGQVRRNGHEPYMSADEAPGALRRIAAFLHGHLSADAVLF